VWANGKIFLTDEDGKPESVAGVPPDYFSADGQLWGNPLYNWEYMKKDGYKWWMDRLSRAFKLYDFVRLDHFRGFESYWSVPAGKKAVDGSWVFGPGDELFVKAYEKFGPLPIIAEDLGMITPAVRGLVARCGFPGMDVMEFYDSDPLYGYHPPEGKIAYSGTHDNATLIGWCMERYPDKDAEKTSNELLEKLFFSEADVVITPLQDVLGLGDEARMNVPGTTGINWQWQAKHDDFGKSGDRLLKLTINSNRS
jgi:4-alpha-glucanotransferase